MAEQPKNTNEPKIQMTRDELQGVVESAVNKALRDKEAEGPAKAPKLRNADLVAEAAGPNEFQTQEDVAMMASTVGPVSHPRGKIADPPEHVVARDFAEHRELISKLEGYGYTVFLDKVEFKARYEPTELRVVDNKPVKINVDAAKHPPNPAAELLLEELDAADPQNSRIWITQWIGGRIVAGEQQLDRLAAEDSHANTVKSRTLAQVEGGDLSGLDNLDGMEIGADPAGVDQVKIG
mgnify:CR=1 FL=1|tara:strand:- start:221 stop:931 length:711 start_codon:yes stop_codon:yes gene_type:complete